MMQDPNTSAAGNMSSGFQSMADSLTRGRQVLDYMSAKNKAAPAATPPNSTPPAATPSIGLPPSPALQHPGAGGGAAANALFKGL